LRRCRPRARVAILLSTDTFESFFEDQLELTRDEYVDEWRGGWVWSYCRMLKEQSIEPVVYVASPQASWPSRDTGRVRGPLPPAACVLPALAEVSGPPAIPPARYLAESVNALALRSQLEESLAEDRIDVLFIQEYWTGRYDVLSGLVQVPLIAVDQGQVHRRQLKLAKRRALPRAFRIITQTQDEAARLSRFGALSMRIPNAVDVDRFKPGTDGRVQGQHVVMAVAGLRDRHKRLSDLIRALPLLPKSWKLELVGTGPDRRRLGELADEIGVGSRVEFAGSSAIRRSCANGCNAATSSRCPPPMRACPSRCSRP
jgi:glycosyltransferase involved in cell wall biosynthesis